MFWTAVVPCRYVPLEREWQPRVITKRMSLRSTQALAVVCALLPRLSAALAQVPSTFQYFYDGGQLIRFLDSTGGGIQYGYDRGANILQISCLSVASGPLSPEEGTL